MLPLGVVVSESDDRSNPALFLDFEGVSRLMILNLETEKSVDSGKCFCIVSGYSQLSTMHGVFGLIRDLAFQSLHLLYSWRNRGMNEHGNGKVTLGKL